MGLIVDRDEARLLAYTRKDRPFIRPTNAVQSPSRRNGETRLEVTLLGPGGATYSQLLDAHFLCISHDPTSPPHIEGDRIVLHRDSFLVELPEIPGFDRIQIAHAREVNGQTQRAIVGTARLDHAHFMQAGGPARYEDLAFADPADGGSPAMLTTGEVLWPEQFNDFNIYTIYGDPSEGPRRINITIVPDGYTYAEKNKIKSDADALVEYFRGKRPYAEHDPFINYTLVYAYSHESGTDQCDCGIIRDTAMGTTFLPEGDPCGGNANRCLYYGSACDPSTDTNIVAAELRAPVHDTTIIMVNTGRYGGCGGQRAVYSAGNSLAVEIAVHELGHTLALLMDEYVSYSGCRSFASEINTSTNGINGAWPEWIADLGPPREGAEYYVQCVFRPFDNCVMRQLGQSFCPVCMQRWALSILGHPRVGLTAPIESSYPPGQPSACTAVPETFSIRTRLPAGANVTNTIHWTLSGPGFPQPTLLATAVTSLTRTFSLSGSYVLKADVIADTDSVKPQKYGQNRDTVVWNISVADPVADNDGDGCGASVDCDNANPAVFPGAPQTCDGLNNDCNEAHWPATTGTNDADDDGDLISECQGDCDDARASVRPGGPQLCGDGLNNNCSDPAWPAVPFNDRDDDGDGVSECQGDCDDAHATVWPGGAQVCGDGLNNDCTDLTWPALPGIDSDDDGDGLRECQGDCDDGHATVRPGGAQVCGDGLNNDCLAAGWPSLAGTNEGDDDGDGMSECTGDCDDGSGPTHPGSVEINDGRDNQCQGDPGYGVRDEISGETGFANPNDITLLCWTPQQGATSYSVRRSGTASFGSPCVPYSAAGSNCLSDPQNPPMGQAYFYLVQAAAPHVGSWGQNSSGIERAGDCLTMCGNGIREGSEVCDGPDLGGETCQSLGFESGSLSCNSTCTAFNTSGCRF